MITPLFARPTTYFSWKFDGTPESIDEFNAALISNGTDSPERGLAVYVSPTEYTWWYGERTYGLNETMGIRLDWTGAHLVDVFQPNELPRLVAQLSDIDLGV